MMLYGCIQGDTLSVYVFIFGFIIAIKNAKIMQEKNTFLSNVQTVNKDTKCKATIYL